MRGILVVVLVAACSSSTRPPPAPPPAPPAWSGPDRADAIAAGAAVIAKHQCTRCHEIDALPGVGRPFDCASCHQFLHRLQPGSKQYEEIAAHNGRDVLERYQKNIQHLLTVPKLTAIGRRVRPDWIAGFLAAPEDLRPLLDESMIRNRLTPDEIRAVVRYFAAVADVPDPYAPGFAPPAPPPPPDAARLAAGRDAFVRWGCPGCHTFGDTVFGAQTAAAYQSVRGVAALAPNLRFARARMTPDAILAWILDPAQVSAGATMPKLGVPPADAEAIRDFLFAAPIEIAAAAPAPTEMPAAVARDVGWAEVKEKVLGNVCVHCHMNDHEKDQGVGNTGGLGYAGKGLSLRTYEMAMRGEVGADGKRFSPFVAQPGERWPRILAVLLARKDENRRDHLAPLDDRERPPYADGVLGMPMGLPALSDDDIGLVRRWLEEGCPGPTAITGKPGFTDGYLVPDGPVKVNHGCQARAPEEPPPIWSTRAPAPR